MLVYLDGSFVTAKESPADFDACWDFQNVDDAALDPVFWDFSRGRAAQKERFMGEFFPAELPEGATGRAFVDFFRLNKLTGEPKGILALVLEAVGDLPKTLIRARIASGITQEGLAHRLGVKTQQIQRYEATEYESASFARIRKVVQALGLRMPRPTRLVRT